MKRKSTLVISILVLLTMALVSQSLEDEKKNVKEVILKAYVQGIKSLGDVDQIKKGFHPDFALLYNRNNSLNKLTLPKWISIVEKKKKSNPDGISSKPVVKFYNIDVTGKAAVVKFDLTLNGRTSTDYMFLLKFNEGWKIVSKISHFHKKK